MTEEEKKAIEDLKEEIEYYKGKYFNSKDDEEYNDKTLYSIRTSVKDSEVLINLIEKLKKEIKYIREYNAELVEANSSLDWDYDELKDNFEHYKLQSIPKDKIREKLEKIEKEKIQYYDAGQPLIYMLLKNQLKSLIEEEQENKITDE